MSLVVAPMPFAISTEVNDCCAPSRALLFEMVNEPRVTLPVGFTISTFCPISMLRAPKGGALRFTTLALGGAADKVARVPVPSVCMRMSSQFFIIVVRSPKPLVMAFWEDIRSEEHTSELQSLRHLVCR